MQWNAIQSEAPEKKTGGKRFVLLPQLVFDDQGKVISMPWLVRLWCCLDHVWIFVLMWMVWNKNNTYKWIQRWYKGQRSELLESGRKLPVGKLKELGTFDLKNNKVERGTSECWVSNSFHYLMWFTGRIKTEWVPLGKQRREWLQYFTMKTLLWKRTNSLEEDASSAFLSWESECPEWPWTFPLVPGCQERSLSSEWRLYSAAYFPRQRRGIYVLGIISKHSVSQVIFAMYKTSSPFRCVKSGKTVDCCT